MSMLCLIHTQAAAQVNLVPNSGFEDYLICPDNEDQVHNCISWYKASAIETTPDYYNSCSPDYYSVPSHPFYKVDHSTCGAGAYMGIATYASNTINYREHIGVKLIQPLVVGTKYYISFHTTTTRLTDGISVYFIPSNSIGIRFSSTLYNVSNPAPIDNFAHLRSVSKITDTLYWVNVSGSFVADSAYDFLTIGNFFDDSNTKTESMDCSGCIYFCYYFFDDICVSTDSMFCNAEPNICTSKNNACVSEDSQCVETDCKFVLPSAFTPNNDGINDIYKWRHNCSGIESFVMRVYNRWGEQVFITDDYNTGWDGSFKGEQQPVDAYIVYVLVVEQGGITTKSSSITLLR